jgi:hypothetical protein
VCGNTSRSCVSPAKSRTDVIPRVPVSIDVGSCVWDLSNFSKLFRFGFFFGFCERIAEYIRWVRNSIFSDRKVNSK